MKNLIIVSLLVFVGLSAQAKKRSCTDKPKNEWMSVEDFKKKVTEMGFKISKFKRPGTCYEIYGTNDKNQKVEVYFNPVDATIVHKEMEE